MDNAVVTTIFSEHNGEIDIKVIAEHRDKTNDFDSARVYSIWNSADEPLGFFIRYMGELSYKGEGLAEDEQDQLAYFIKQYREGEWDL